jgi:SurA N-terminal domain
MDQHHEVEATETSATQATPSAAAEVKSKRPSYLTALGLIGIIGIAGAGYVFYTRTQVPVVAVVNGTNITQEELDENVNMMKKSAELQGIDVSDAAVVTEIENQAIVNLINNELLLGAAKRAGLSTNEAAVQTAYEGLVSEFGSEEELKVRMESFGLTPEVLRGNITDRLIVDAYIEAETDIEEIEVTDAEVEGYLASATTEGVTLPPLEEIRPQIEATLIAERQQAIVDALIERLRSESTIEIKKTEE